MDKKFLIIMAIIGLAFVGIFFFSGSNNNSDSANGSSGTVSNHTIGANSKNVEVMVYGDFECPACGQFYPVEKQIIQNYSNDIKFVFRHFPIDSIHPNARAASRAAEAAGLQGKFFEMHDLLYENQQQWSSQITSSPQSIFENYAKELNLDIAKYNADYAAESTNSTINADKQAGGQVGVNGTPTYFINGQKMSNSDIGSYEAFAKKIDEAIAASSTN